MEPKSVPGSRIRIISCSYMRRTQFAFVNWYILANEAYSSCSGLCYKMILFYSQSNGRMVGARICNSKHLALTESIVYLPESCIQFPTLAGFKYSACENSTRPKLVSISGIGNHFQKPTLKFPKQYIYKYETIALVVWLMYLVFNLRVITVCNPHESQ